MSVRTDRSARYDRIERKTQYYVDGSAVRAARPEQLPERRREHVQTHRSAERVREAESISFEVLNAPLTFLLIAAVVVSVFIGYRYLCLKSSLNAHMSEIKTLETRLDVMRTENDALEKSIDTSVDLNKVYSVAVNELGMVRVGQDNIIQYDKTESEYVKQYDEIPSE